MTRNDTPYIHCEQHHPGLASGDVRTAIEFYTTKLGFESGFTWGDPPEIAGVNLGEVQIFLSQGKPGPDGCTLYFVVDDADELHQFHRANGVEVIRPPGDRPWGIRDYTIRDLNGYLLVFGHRLPEREPPIEIERVDVPLRLERRLAALLHDLALHKRMSLDSCIEETLLHTFEPVGNGVASPHTVTTLRYIRKLKEKHGIDYDSHASYRFVETGGTPPGDRPPDVERDE